jgi:hypothetical protein
LSNLEAPLGGEGLKLQIENDEVPSVVLLWDNLGHKDTLGGYIFLEKCPIGPSEECFSI